MPGPARTIRNLDARQLRLPLVGVVLPDDAQPERMGGTGPARSDMELRTRFLARRTAPGKRTTKPMNDLGITKEELLEMAAAKLADEYADHERICDKAENEIRARIDRLF